MDIVAIGGCFEDKMRRSYSQVVRQKLLKLYLHFVSINVTLYYFCNLELQLGVFFWIHPSYLKHILSWFVWIPVEFSPLLNMELYSIISNFINIYVIFRLGFQFFQESSSIVYWLQKLLVNLHNAVAISVLHRNSFTKKKEAKLHHVWQI